eukprot:gene1351-4527_t
MKVAVIWFGVGVLVGVLLSSLSTSYVYSENRRCLPCPSHPPCQQQSNANTAVTHSTKEIPPSSEILDREHNLHTQNKPTQMKSTEEKEQSKSLDDSEDNAQKTRSVDSSENAIDKPKQS